MTFISPGFFGGFCIVASFRRPSQGEMLRSKYAVQYMGV